MENLNIQEFDMAFFNDGYRIADESFESGVSRLSLIEMTGKVYDYIDSFMEQFLEQCESSNSKVDCKKGCAWCCHQSVFVLPHEAYYLYTHLKKSGDEKSFSEFKNKIREKNQVTSIMKLTDVLRNTQPCPFLENNICMVYDFRPMACRLFQSMEVQSCITERQNPGNMDVYARLYELPLRAGRMLNEGIAAWFTKRGLKTTEWIIESSLGLLFNDEKAIYQWMKGDECFKTRDLTPSEWEQLRKFDKK